MLTQIENQAKRQSLFEKVFYFFPALKTTPYLIPCFFTLFTLGVSQFHVTQVTGLMPFVSIASLYLCGRYKRLGWGIASLSVVALYFMSYKEFPSELRAWHVGIFFSLSISHYVMILVREESEAASVALEEEKRIEGERVSHILQMHKEKEASDERERERLIEELEKWKEEAKQRRIERESLEKRMELIATELTLYDAQKEALIEEAQKAAPDYEEWKRKVAAAEGRYMQLRGQFEEKTKVLDQTRKDLYQMEGKLLAYEREEQLRALDYDREDALFFQREARECCLEIEELEKEITTLQDLITE